ncbi:phytoene desaturase family protein [Streptomyces sp. TP-A0874]|uniref:phytoene desaturase family protein n=1 Tax=Streptomyces sp. TP-A0874 TaxID=549819 RepID=UPI00085306F6|nr:NAD(P)/FAD-dependent oxidoreductase [Streptomyces sp. TP-A0874]
MPSMLDAVVVGAGPNGLTAAVELARRGLAVAVYEAADTVGGGARTEELTLPGFRHDPCSAVHPLGVGSPAFADLPLARHGLEWLHPELPMAHPFPDGTAARLARSVGETAASLGARDAGTYRRLVAPYTGHWETLARDLLRTPWLGTPTDPLRWARYMTLAPQPLALLARRFSGDRARGLLAGLAAHVISAPHSPAGAGVALLFALAAHAGGWPVARGGSQAIADALTGYLREQGGTVHTGTAVRRLDELPPARAYVFDTSPTALARIAGLGGAYRGFRHGPGVFKVDYALSGPVPWLSADARRAGTVHLGPGYGDIADSLRRAVRGQEPDVPFLITAQPSLVDATRAPEGQHTFWVYGHVPNGWSGDLTGRIERQLERFAPGFRDLVLARATAGPPELAARNPNYVGGDIGCGAFDGLQSVLRPRLARVPYATSHPAVFLCSSATPPGGGVHGMCGHHAARRVWRWLRQH